MPFRPLDAPNPGEVVRTSHQRFSSGALGRTRTCDLLIRGGRPTARRTSVAGEKGTKRSIYAPLVANLLIVSSKFVVGFASAIFACSSGRPKDRGCPWS
jgi:hypothetical protein